MAGLFDAIDRDGVAVRGTTDGDILAGMSHELVLIGNLVDLSVRRYQNGRRATLDALFGALTARS
jgi:hypothetical protein